MLGSSIARAILALALVALLLLSLACAPDSGVHNIKDLADTVMHLTQQIQHFGSKDEPTKRDELETLEHRLDEKEIELVWEKQHVESQIEARKLMAKTMSGQIVKEQEALQRMQEQINGVAGAGATHQHELEAKLSREHRENENLKQSLASALKQLAEARATLPAAPPSPRGTGVAERTGWEVKSLGDGDASKRKLRGAFATSYQPGDSIEIIEYQEGGEIALHPGFVNNVHSDGTYDLVKIESSIIIPQQGREHFQTYHVYQEGTKAIYTESRFESIPITIVGFLQGSAWPGFELHGVYRFTFDRDKKKEVNECRAMGIHRLAGVSEMTGSRSNDGVRDDF